MTADTFVCSSIHYEQNAAYSLNAALRLSVIKKRFRRWQVLSEVLRQCGVVVGAHYFLAALWQVEKGSDGFRRQFVDIHLRQGLLQIGPWRREGYA
jgi:hypothetical protein